MPAPAHLWAIGYPDLTAAEKARQEFELLATVQKCLTLYDVAIVTRRPDGSAQIDRKPFPRAGNVFHDGVLDFLIGFALAVPLYGPAVDAFFSPDPGEVGIDAQFISDVKAMLKPGTAALLVLDEVGDLDKSLSGIRGLGGTILKTNVDLKRARLIQSTLHAPPPKD
ncbi:MAG TPA: DUF1269 domain-containing protein [Tepidisphaeraceae bacterium]|nr:DUF1269 domain-containing protein [Tepidisphaeraceae bacterium]